MTERLGQAGMYPDRVRGERPFKYQPRDIIPGYLETADFPPNQSSINMFGDSVRALLMAHGGPKDALQTCGELAITWPDATIYWATMIQGNHDAIPPEWQRNPNAARTTLVMSGQVELGWLQARQSSHMHAGRIPRIDAKIVNLTDFVHKLQER